MKRYTLLILLAALGCHAQVATTTPAVSLTWTAPTTGCTTAAPCSYIISRATVATAATACPSNTGTAYAALNQATPVSALTYTDTAPPANGFVCYIAQADNGFIGSPSAPSNSGAAVAVPSTPGIPGAPAATLPTTAKADISKPVTQDARYAGSAPSNLRASLR